jgi:D-alanyl-D-alanine carboxypeptidase/D-alanyl-D-alanine-endopeptidase (penicillin-binding protein 4)
VLAYTSSLIDRGHNPETQGFIVSTMDGQILAEFNADRSFNPASVVKMATSLVTISRLGPDFRFRTTLYTDGTVDPATGILHGSLYVIGSGDPAFFYENALLIADKLNRSGIRVVEGDLVVLGPFYFNFSASREMSAKGFRTTLTPETWTAAARTAFPRFLSMRAAEDRTGTASSIEPPSLKITGKTTTDAAVNTSNLKILAVHTSLPLVRLLKGLNDFSNNWMASAVGNMVGGPDAVERFLKTEVGLKAEELNIVTASGLGSNYISPRATLQILRKLLAYLQKERLGIEELLPVAGIDAGTLGRRFTDAYRGSVVAKTGTLSGVSALAGVAYTRTKGPLLFVIYNHGGSPGSFRSVQDETIKKLITFFGGPAPVRYSPGGGPGISDRISETSTRSLPPTSPR